MAFIFEQDREKKLEEYLRFLISKLDCYFEHLLKSLGEIDKDTLLNIRNCLNEFENIKAEVRTNNDNTAIHIQSLLNLTEEHIQAMVNTVERKMTELLPETVFPMVEAEVSVLAPNIIKEEVSALVPSMKKEVKEEVSESLSQVVSTEVAESVQNLRNDETFIEQIKGKDGKDGIDGKDGKNGYTPRKGIDYTDGKDGYTPVKDVDYFDGKTAYQYAKDGGYTGTEAEFASKLAKEYLTAETDPTVPSWAKASSKPTYSKSEVGLGNVDNVKQYSASNPPPYPVSSVNNKTGKVSLTYADINIPTEVWSFELEDGSTVNKTVAILA